jgi:hypothetical protein
MGNGLAERHRSVGHADRIKASTLGRRLSHRPVEPPTSHDAYLQKQAELARRRASCKPMIHSRASIAAELTEVRDTQAKNVMETFFMS